VDFRLRRGIGSDGFGANGRFQIKNWPPDPAGCSLQRLRAAKESSAAHVPRASLPVIDL
jgi:hypothetical protein